MAKILIVDDEIKIREVVKEYAKLYGYECDEAKDGMEALDMVQANDYDIVVLDIMMPRLDGFATCKKIKALKDVPIIILSARHEEHDKLFGFDSGIDDYVTKPFSPKELMARIKVIIDRHNTENKNDIMTFEGLVIDPEGRQVTLEGNKLNLTPKEIDLIVYLAKNRNIALSREKLLDAVWKYDYSGDERTVDTHIKMLRHNLGEKYRKHIVTVRGMGYKFEV